MSNILNLMMHKNNMENVRKIFFLVSIITGSFAVYLSFQSEQLWDSEESRYEKHGIGVAVSIDSGVDGGAAGFAVLSGLALVAASITYLKKE